MDVYTRDPNALIESTITQAITAYQAKRYKSIRATIYAFLLLETTL